MFHYNSVTVLNYTRNTFEYETIVSKFHNLIINLKCIIQL